MTGKEQLRKAIDRLEGKAPIDWSLLSRNGTLFRVEKPGPGQRLEHKNERAPK